MTGATDIFTIGHSTHPIGEFIALLRAAGIGTLVDVRRVPRSRRNPQYNSDALPQPLADAGIAYRHMPELGGLRHHPKGAPPSPNGLWRNDSFRNYADYALTGAFRTALAEVCRLAAERPVAIMCAEAVWWRCHRRIITDHLLARGYAVTHLLPDGTREPAQLTEGAVIEIGAGVIYPPADGQGMLAL